MAEEKVKADTTGKKKKVKGKKDAQEKKKNKKPKVKNNQPNEKKPADPKKKQLPESDTSNELPPIIKEKKILARNVDRVQPIKVGFEEVAATSQSIYVDDIHHANPTRLQTIYWIIMPNTSHIIARVSKEQYEEILQKKPTINHHVNVVDCSVVPTLTYGSWKVSQLKDGFPSMKQIEAQDEEFKNNPTRIHNQPVKIELIEKQMLEQSQKETDSNESNDDNEKDEDEDFFLEELFDENEEEENEEEDWT